MSVSQTVRLPGQHGEVAIFAKDSLPLSAWDCRLSEFDFTCGLVLCSKPVFLSFQFITPRFLLLFV